MPPHSLSYSDLDGHLSHVPGEPSIDLTQASVRSFLSSELGTPVLDQLYDYIWCVARKSGKSIDPMNTQRVKAREIIATEDASLHLVWHRNIIYIKPMPLCLLNHDFWTNYLTLPVENPACNENVPALQQHSSRPVFDRRIALGFMRSYALLVRHQIDFVLARESHLFPAQLDWADWAAFIAHFRCIEDDDVAERYHYGQLRLSRLNWAVRVFRPSSARTKWFYAVPYWSTGTYMEHATTPLLFVFATLSLALSSMQVLLAVPDDGVDLNQLHASSLLTMRRAFWMFSIMILLLSGLFWALLFGVPASVIVWQLTWGFKNKTGTNAPGWKAG